MKKLDKQAAVSGLVDRRGFLTGVSVVITGLPLQLYAAPPAAEIASADASRALFQQQPYYSFGHASATGIERYDAPRGSKATRDYRAGISHEEFLRRHWFS